MRSIIRHSGQGCAGRGSALVGSLLSLAALALGPAASPAAAGCPKTPAPTYTDECGPTFVLPSWGDAGGWTDPEYYTTIQLADVDGDGKDELLARTPGGLSVQVFDTDLGQWRPQVDSQDRPIVLTAFADPPPLTTATPSAPKTDWRLPQYYDTIQAADIDGQKGDEVLARSADGIIVFKFTPGTRPGTGSWAQVSQSGPLAGSDWDAPYYFATIQTGDVNGDQKAELIARGKNGITTQTWDGKSWTQLGADPSILSDKAGFQDPAYYTSIQLGDVLGDEAKELVARSTDGVSVYSFASTGWSQLSATHPFSDREEGPDCPMMSGSTACLGTAPAYYSTLQLADIDGSGQDALVARASDGVSAYLFDTGTNRFTPAGPPPPRLLRLSALSDAGGANKEPYYATLQFADIDGNGTDEALARDKDGLEAWSFDGAQWTKLPASPALTLVDDPWGDASTTAAGDRSRSYYATIQTGDVDGDGSADVVARGPYGIRTWFYNRRRTGGWERYLTDGYPAFTGSQENAYARLSRLARSLGYLTGDEQLLRDLWARSSAPTADLQTVMTNLAKAAGCPDSQQALPHYDSCTPPPSDVSGFTPADWTAVVNEIVAELYYANQVKAHFLSSTNGIKTVWQSLLLDELADKDAIANALEVQALKDATAAYDAKELFSSIFGIGSAVIGVAGPEGEALAASFEIASEVISALPSSSESLTNDLNTTYSKLETAFAEGTSDAANAIDSQYQFVRQDLRLLTLVGQLRARGTWQLDPVGMRSVGEQGFALWVYQTLLPAAYARYVITQCQPSASVATCATPPSGTGGLLGTAPNFTLIGPSPTRSSPCSIGDEIGDAWNCNFVAPPSDLAGKLWGKLSSTCAYDGQNAASAWKLSCNLGVDPQASITASPLATRDWAFPTRTGAPVPNASSRLAGSVARVGRSRSLLRLSGRVRIPSSLRLGRTKVAVRRLLHEPGGAGELAGARLRSPMALSPTSGSRGGGRVFASKRSGNRRVRLRLRRRSRTSLAFVLSARVPQVSLPDACSGVRRGVDLAAGPVLLHTRLRIRYGHGRSLPLSLRPHWRCHRNRLGAVNRLVVRQPRRRTPSQDGLAVTLDGPSGVRAGGMATYRIKVSNRRRTPAYDVLVHGLLPRGLRTSRARGSRGGPRYRTWRMARLRPGRSRTVRLRVRVAASASRARRVVALAQAIDTRPVSDRFSTRIRP